MHCDGRGVGGRRIGSAEANAENHQDDKKETGGREDAAMGRMTDSPRLPVSASPCLPVSAVLDAMAELFVPPPDPVAENVNKRRELFAAGVGYRVAVCHKKEIDAQPGHPAHEYAARDIQIAQEHWTAARRALIGF